MALKLPEKIYKSFDEFCMILDYLRKEGQISLIEKDIALEKLRELYNYLSNETKIVKTESAQIIPEPEIPPLIDKVITEPEQEEKSVSDQQNSNEISELHDNIAEKTNERTEKKEHKQIIGESLQREKEAINEHISKQQQSDGIAVKLQSRPIEDIGKAIGLNDKFLFINELFQGDALLFKKTIEILNNLTDFNEAFSYVDSNFHWDMNKDEVQKFIDIVRRKYISPAK